MDTYGDLFHIIDPVCGEAGCPMESLTYIEVTL